MTVKELKEKLNEYPDDMKVACWEGHCGYMDYVSGFKVFNPATEYNLDIGEEEDNEDKRWVYTHKDSNPLHEEKQFLFISNYEEKDWER